MTSKTDKKPAAKKVQDTKAAPKAAATETKPKTKVVKPKAKVVVDNAKRARDAKISKEKLREKARKNLKNILKNGKRTRSGKIHTSVHFRVKKPLELPKAPKYVRHSVPKSRALDKYEVLKHPLTAGEGVLKLIEEQNTIIFITALSSSKRQIKKAFESMYETKVEKVRTVIRSTGDKKAFIKLPKDVEAVELATKIGIC
ncbi:ribosomal protein L23 [Acrasis kona]|uniref:Ribosomal protein L23 n=1 Tax=Acrasis kona TaxID=1008807 RepID=A0AAW2YNH1_9EUKA